MNFVRTALLGTAVGLLLGLVPMANAQTDPFTNAEFRLRGGVYLPTDSAVKDVEDVWAAIGGDVLIGGFFGPNSTTVLSADIINRSGGRGSGTLIPLLIGQLFYLTPRDVEVLGPSIYVSGSVGLVLADVGGPSKTRFAGKLAVGVDLNQNLFLEIGYLLTDKFPTAGGARNGRADGFLTQIGWRF